MAASISFEVLRGRGARAAGSSSAKRSCPLATPWVRLDSMNPPLRPLAAEPTSPPSISTTSRDGSRSLAMIAVHSPVYPPPTTQRSQRLGPHERRVAVGLVDVVVPVRVGVGVWRSRRGGRRPSGRGEPYWQPYLPDGHGPRRLTGKRAAVAGRVRRAGLRCRGGAGGRRRGGRDLRPGRRPGAGRGRTDRPRLRAVGRGRGHGRGRGGLRRRGPRRARPASTSWSPTPVVHRRATSRRRPSTPTRRRST